MGAGVAAAFGLSDVLTPAALAGSSSRAIVCLYLVGGNDSNNMIVPLDSPAYDAYLRGRGALGLTDNVLLPVQSDSLASYGFHPSLPGLRDLYSQNALAIVANVGRVAPDHVVLNDASDHTREMQLTYLPNAYLTMPWAIAGATPPPVLPLAHSVSLAAPEAHPERHRSVVETIAASPLQDGFPATQLGRQLSTVLSALKLGEPRQPAFLVPFSGFETSRDQLNAQAALFAELNDALVAFYQALGELGMADLVTIYTDTEFNRTLAPNRFGGTDHAWGGHQLVIGSSVLGGRIYGQFPSLVVGGADDAAGNGTWAPTTTSAQYYATLAHWYRQIDLRSIPAYAASAGAAETRLSFLRN